MSLIHYFTIIFSEWIIVLFALSFVNYSLQLFAYSSNNKFISRVQNQPLRHGIKSRNPRIPSGTLDSRFRECLRGFADGISFDAIARVELRLANVELHVLCNSIRRSAHARQAVEDVRHTDRTILVASPNSKSC